MINKISLLCLATLLMAIGCATQETPVAENDVKDDGPTLTSVIAADECLDLKMDFWFSNFNQFQAEGYDMYEANDKATAVIAEKFKGCDEKKDDRMASRQSPSGNEDGN